MNLEHFMQQTKRIKNALRDVGSRPLQGTFLLLGDTVDQPPVELLEALS